MRLRLRDLQERLPAFDGLVTGFHRDVIAAFRHLRRAPSSALIAIVTLGLASAAVVTVASILYVTVLNPLPYPADDRSVIVWRVDPSSPDNWLAVTPGDFVEWRRDVRSFDTLVAGRNIAMTLYRP